MIWLFFLNLFLAIIYVALTGEPTLWTFIVGFVLGYVVITLYCRSTGMSSYGGKAIHLLRFGLYFLKNMVVANLEVAYEVLTPGWRRMQPRIIRYPVDDLSEVELTAFANAISLTPGTLSTDVDEQAKVLYVHDMYAHDYDAAVRDLDELKRRLLAEVFGR